MSEWAPHDVISRTTIERFSLTVLADKTESCGRWIKRRLNLSREAPDG
jgi:hypothetical protein